MQYENIFFKTIQRASNNGRMKKKDLMGLNVVALFGRPGPGLKGEGLNVMRPANTAFKVVQAFKVTRGYPVKNVL